MKKFDQKLLAFLLAACCLYGGFLLYDRLSTRLSTGPELTVPEEAVQVSVADPASALLAGVTAKDAQDGDLTGRVFVESLSPMDEQGQRTVTYGVFDRDDQVTRASRPLRYTDYAPPVFSLNAPLLFPSEVDDGTVLNRLTVSSVLDGDLSNQIMIESAEEENGVYTGHFSVTDSAGTVSRIALKVSFLHNDPSYQIGLSQYLVRVAPGTPIDPRSYLQTVTMMNMDYSDLLDEVEVRTDYNPQVPGTYEFIYQLQRPNGDFGTTKLVVIVE